MLLQINIVMSWGVRLELRLAAPPQLSVAVMDHIKEEKQQCRQ